MEKPAQFNLAYLVFALFAILLLQQWWQRAQTIEVVPYSEFEKRLEKKTLGDARSRH